MKSLSLRLLCMLFVFLCCALNGCSAEPRFVEVEGETISVDELFSRIHVASTAEFQNAVGYYVVRNYEKRDEKKDAEALDNLRHSLEKALEMRIASDKEFGFTTSEDEIRQIRESDLQILADREKFQVPVHTRVERYTIEGDNYRIERINVSNRELIVSNTDSLEKIRQDVLAGLIDFSKPNVITWNGKVTAEIIISENRNSFPEEIDGMPVVKHDAMSSVVYEQLARLPEFMNFGRDLKDKKFLDQFRKMGLPLSVTSIIIDGEQGLLLRIGDKSSVTFLVETGVLPSKGYAVAFGRVKIAGATQIEDDYKDFVKVNDGSWLPTRITRTSYKLDSLGVPYVATKMEMLAIEPPQLNVKLDKDTFNLADTREFQSLEPLFALPFESREMTSKRAWGIMRWNLAIIGIIMIIWALFKIWQKRRLGQVGIFIAALGLSALSGCQNSDDIAKVIKHDVILTDSGVIVGHPNRVIPVTAPVGMGIKKELTIKSEYPHKIEAMTVSTTCGSCSEVFLQNSEISPGETVVLELKCVY